MEGCPNLIEVCLEGCSISDASGDALANACTGMKAVYLGSTDISDVSATALASRCPQLTKVYFDDTQITDDGLVALAHHCPGIQQMNVSFTAVSDVGLRALAAGCRQLTTLWASNNELITFSPPTVAALAQLPNLSSIQIDECPNIPNGAIIDLGLQHDGYFPGHRLYIDYDYDQDL